MTQDEQQSPAGPRYTAHFTPEAWVRDQAVEVDAPGPQEWDCSAYARQHPDYLAGTGRRRGEHLDDPAGVLDNDDVFLDDPAAPEWVRTWQGPFTIRVREEAQVTSNDDTAWPAGKTFGELTAAQRRAATERAAARLQAELTAAAPGIARVLADQDKGITYRVIYRFGSTEVPSMSTHDTREEAEAEEEAADDEGLDETWIEEVTS